MRRRVDAVNTALGLLTGSSHDPEVPVQSAQPELRSRWLEKLSPR
jgi:hypothetical protein